MSQPEFAPGTEFICLLSTIETSEEGLITSVGTANEDLFPVIVELKTHHSEEMSNVQQP
jgi:hypothetical protein